MLRTLSTEQRRFTLLFLVVNLVPSQAASKAETLLTTYQTDVRLKARSGSDHPKIYYS
jgi:hypothetical protein